MVHIYLGQTKLFLCNHCTPDMVIVYKKHWELKTDG